MAANQGIIKEFLVSLGFKVDQRGLRDFEKGVDDATKVVEVLVATVASAALAILADVAAFSRSIENLYFVSQRSGASVSGLKALGKAAESFGIDSKEAAANVESLAASLRNNPGNEAWINSWGVKTREANGELRDMNDIMVDIGKELQKYPSYQRKMYSDSIGISEKMMLAITNPAFAATVKKYQEPYGGNDFDLAAQKAHNFQNKIRDLEAELDKLGVIFRSEMLDLLGPKMDETTKWFERNQEKNIKIIHLMGEAVKDLRYIIDPLWDKVERIFSVLYSAGAWIGNTAKGAAGELTDFSLMPSHGISANDLKMGHSAGLVDKKPTGKDEWLDSLDKKYGLPPGFMKKVVGAESGGDSSAVSPKGAMGAGQLMPATAAQYGVKNPFDFYENTDASARYYRDLYIRYSGNMQKAAAAYNWGPGNLDKYGLGAAPLETKNYVDKVAGGIQVTQTNNITVNGAGDPAAVGKSVAREQEHVGADLTRNLQSAVR